jgi:hypothetical protein
MAAGIAAAGLALLAAACTSNSVGPGVASLGSSSPSASSTGSDSNAKVAFSRYIRAHGIHNFPDPNADGQFPETQMRGLGKGAHSSTRRRMPASTT